MIAAHTAVNAYKSNQFSSAASNKKKKFVQKNKKKKKLIQNKNVKKYNQLNITALEFNYY